MYISLEITLPNSGATQRINDIGQWRHWWGFGLKAEAPSWSSVTSGVHDDDDGFGDTHVKELLLLLR